MVLSFRAQFTIWFLGKTHQRVSLEKLWAIRKIWSCPEILYGYRKSLLTHFNEGTRNQQKLCDWRGRKREDLRGRLCLDTKMGNFTPCLRQRTLTMTPWRAECPYVYTKCMDFRISMFFVRSEYSQVVMEWTFFPSIVTTPLSTVSTIIPLQRLSATQRK